MARKPTYKELEQKINLLEDRAIKEKLELKALYNSQIELLAILAKTPLFMMILDQERRVKKVSDLIIKFSGKPEAEILGLRGGEALRCVNHLEDPQGCGFSTACEDCSVKLTVLDTFKTGNSHQKVEAKLSIIGDEVEERTFLVSTTLLDSPDKRVLVFIEDITERKLSQKKLKESETKYRSILAGIEDSYLEVDLGGNFQFFNNSLCKLLGCSKDELTGRKSREFLDKANAEKVFQIFQNIYKTGNPENEVGFEFIRKDGKIRFVEASVSLITDSRDERSGFCLIGRDITERIHAKIRLEKELEAVSAVLRNMLRGEVDDAKTEEKVLDVCLTATDSVYGMIGIVNAHGKFDTTTYSSRTLQDCAFPEALAWEMSTGMTIRGVWGYPMLHGKPLLCNDLQAHPDRVGAPEGHVAIKCFLGAPLIRDQEVIGMVAVANRPGGYMERELETLIRLAAVISVSRQHRLALQSSKRASEELEQLVQERTSELLKTNEQMKREIDERKQVEEAMRESEEKYRNLFELESDALAIVKKETGNMLDVNKTFIELYGYSKEEILKMKYTDFSEEPEITKPATSTPVPYIPIRYHRKKDGTVFPTEITSSVFRYQEEDVIIAAIRDISERIRLEDRLRRAHKAEAIGTLAGGIAHEFNNILGIIIGNTELAISDVPEWNPAKDCLKEIRTASLRATDVVRQIMSFVRKTAATRKPINISSIVIESLKLMRASIPTSVEIRQEILCQSEMILANATEISQILMNLCSNSAHAMEDETGILEVKLETVVLNDRSAVRYEDLEAGDYVKLTVKDRGSGIDSKIIDRIMDPYFTTKDVDKGLGMGLAVVFGLVKKHDGAIKFTSAVGKGTTAEVLFPVTKEKAETETKKNKASFTGTERILVVDDEASIVKMVRRTLEKQGYQVVGKTSSPEALRLFQTDSDQFDLVITDTAMPDISGDRLAKELIKIRADIAVILCTGHSDRIDEDKAKDLGISAYTTKPLDMGRFTKMVREILDKTRS